MSEVAYQTTIGDLNGTPVDAQLIVRFTEDRILKFQLTSHPLHELDLQQIVVRLEKDLWKWDTNKAQLFETPLRLRHMNSMAYAFDGQQCPQLGPATGKLLVHYFKHHAYHLQIGGSAGSTTDYPERSACPSYGDILLPEPIPDRLYRQTTETVDGRNAELKAMFRTTDEQRLLVQLECSSALLAEEMAFTAKCVYHRIFSNYNGQLYKFVSAHQVLYDPDGDRPIPTSSAALLEVLSRFVLDQEHTLSVDAVALQPVDENAQ